MRICIKENRKSWWVCVTLLVPIFLYGMGWQLLSTVADRPASEEHESGLSLVAATKDEYWVRADAKRRRGRRSGPANIPARRERTQTSSPNFVFIAIDDLKRLVGFMGDEPGNFLATIYPDPVVRDQIRQILTPNIDSLAASGHAFTKAFCPYPLCNPSRTALMKRLL